MPCNRIEQSRFGVGQVVAALFKHIFPVLACRTADYHKSLCISLGGPFNLVVRYFHLGVKPRPMRPKARVNLVGVAESLVLFF